MPTKVQQESFLLLLHFALDTVEDFTVLDLVLYEFQYLTVACFTMFRFTFDSLNRKQHSKATVGRLRSTKTSPSDKIFFMPEQ